MTTGTSTSGWAPWRTSTPWSPRPTGLGQAFNFDLLQAPFAAGDFCEIVARCLAEAQASGASSTWVFSNHDVVRQASRYSLPDGTDAATQDAWLLSGGRVPAVDPARGLRRARAATLFMLGLPGSAYLYQGEELGLFEAADLPLDSLRDPTWFRTGNKSKGRDGCRVALPWDSQVEHLGFGGPPWLPQPGWFAEHAVSAHDGVKDSTLEFYRSALAWRRRLQTAESLAWVSAPDAVLAHYRRPPWLGGADQFRCHSGRAGGGSRRGKDRDGQRCAARCLHHGPGGTTLWFTP